MDPLDVARRELAAAHHLAVHDGLAEGTWNHFSLMLPDDSGRMLITPADRHWSQVTASSLEIVDDDAEAMRARGGQFWIGYRIHAPVHRARPDAKCMLHLHPPYTTALTLLEEDHLLMASQMSVSFYGRDAYNDVYDGFAGSDERQGEAIAEALGDKSVLFLRGHGVVVVGETVADAYNDLYVLELACRSQVLAQSTGRRLFTFSDEEAARLVPRDTSKESRRHFDAMLRLLDAQGADYAS